MNKQKNGLRSLAVAALFFLPLQAMAASPYVGMEGRTIKALSPEDITAYLEGNGKGLSLAAELNHYPGPAHVLEMADELQLRPSQRARTRELHLNMRTKARRIGKAIVDNERKLDALLARGSFRDSAMQQLVTSIARLQGELRFVHMKAHVDQRALLTEEQLARYDALRGYRQGEDGASATGEAAKADHSGHSHPGQ